MPSLEDMSGEKKLSPQLKLNQIRLNGQTGVFLYRDILNPTEEDGKKVFKETDLGKSIDLIFLKIRRKLVQYRDEEKPLMSQEHTTKSDMIVLYGDEKVRVGSNEDIRKEYPLLKTQQIVYALYKGELVRVIIQGASLGSKSKADNVFDFYSYISSFKKDGRDAHFYEYITTLEATPEKGKLGTYFCMGYKEGEKLNDEQMKLVEEQMTLAYTFCLASDEHYSKFKENSTEVADTPPVEEDDGVDINPEDIPF